MTFSNVRFLEAILAQVSAVAVGTRIYSWIVLAD